MRQTALARALILVGLALHVCAQQQVASVPEVASVSAGSSISMPEGRFLGVYWECIPDGDQVTNVHVFEWLHHFPTSELRYWPIAISEDVKTRLQALKNDKSARETSPLLALARSTVKVAPTRYYVCDGVRVGSFEITGETTPTYIGKVTEGSDYSSLSPLLAYGNGALLPDQWIQWLSKESVALANTPAETQTDREPLAYDAHIELGRAMFEIKYSNRSWMPIQEVRYGGHKPSNEIDPDAQQGMAVTVTQLLAIADPYVVLSQKSATHPQRQYSTTLEICLEQAPLSEGQQVAMRQLLRPPIGYEASIKEFIDEANAFLDLTKPLPSHARLADQLYLQAERTGVALLRPLSLMIGVVMAAMGTIIIGRRRKPLAPIARQVPTDAIKVNVAQQADNET